MKPRGFWSWVLLVTAVSSLLMAGWCGYSSWAGFRNFDRWTVAETIRMTVDFSKPGRFEAPFVHVCTASHGALLGLELSPPFQNLDEARTAIGSEMNAKIEIRDEAGELVEEHILDGDDFTTDATAFNYNGRGKEAVVPAASVYPNFRKGTYKLSLEVLKPSTALAGRKQSLVGRYALCGLEKMPALVLAVASAGLLALAAGGFWAFHAVSKRRLA